MTIICDSCKYYACEKDFDSYYCKKFIDDEELTQIAINGYKYCKFFKEKNNRIYAPINE